jgi:hypothetical protein
METNNHPPSRQDVCPKPTAGVTAHGTNKAAAEFERAIAAAERDGPAPDVHPRVHQAMIEAMRSELAVLREQLDDS